MLSYRAWQQEYGSDPTHGRFDPDPGWPSRSPSSASRLPGFFGETLRSDPPEVWVPHQSGAALPRLTMLSCIAFRRGCASSADFVPELLRRHLPARLTNDLRLWLVNDSGMPADWMAGLSRPLCRSR